ncbi:hypothetical protein [Geomesophilobacter sediminis]|uniref:Lipoprotein n=1 Tax=Geomesophilobacter sediminis TaxID=2798584 RepID=A0A8J7JLB5_9BACT|nr:hypothetical protein [Geomesophilobacter sediminis]MBJ6724700.1 hypothetical protein [Geomesophilobacter sediminis]
MQKAFVAAVVALLAAGCSQTTVKTEWKDPAYAGPAVRSVVVLCLPPDSREKQCEDEFITQLKEKGIAATSGHSSIASASSRDNALARARQLGVERLLVSRFLQRKSQLDIYPREDSMLMMPDEELWGGYDYVENRYQVFATVLYDVTRGKPIWTAESDTFERPSEKKTLRSYVKAMVKKMQQRGLLAR